MESVEGVLGFPNTLQAFFLRALDETEQRSVEKDLLTTFKTPAAAEAALLEALEIQYKVTPFVSSWISQESLLESPTAPPEKLPKFDRKDRPKLSIMASPYSLPPEKQEKSVSRSGKLAVCKYCGYVTKYQYYMKRHVRIHTNEKPFTCSICGKAFKNKSYLKVHTRIHCGDKVCRCTYCNYTCCDRSNMTKHQRIHTQEKPYSCQTCGRKFAQSGSLKRHERIHSAPRNSRGSNENC